MDAKGDVLELARDEVVEREESDASRKLSSPVVEQIVVSDTVVPTNSDDNVESNEVRLDSDNNITAREDSQEDNDDTSNEEHEKEKPGLLDLPAVVDGRRNRATVQRLAMQTPEAASPKSAYKGGIGVSLGSIDYIGAQLDKHLSSELKTMHRLLFGTPGKQSTVKREIRGFSGFDFGEHDVSFVKRTTMCYKLTGNELKFIKNILGLNMHGYGTTKDQLDHHRKVASKKRKASTGGSAKKTKKTKKEGESQEVGSSGEEEEIDGEEDVKVQAKTSKKTSISRATPKKAVVLKKSDVKAKTSDATDPNEAAMKNENSATDKDASEEDNIEGSPDVSNDSDDSPAPVEKSKSTPSDDTIVETIKDLLDTFDLSQVSMKQMCQAVMEKFPGSDLEERKSWLKEKIKAQLLNVK